MISCRNGSHLLLQDEQKKEQDTHMINVANIGNLI
jgi:hypothetical protein